jgi:hypothetical protein
MVGQRAIACTEFGYHTRSNLTGTRAPNAEVAESVLWDLTFFDERAVRLASVY